MNENNRYQIYEDLMTDIKDMIDDKDRGYEEAQALNNEFWEELGTHRQRMLEQIDTMKKTQNQEEFELEAASADSIYEAARNYIDKYKR